MTRTWEPVSRADAVRGLREVCVRVPRKASGRAGELQAPVPRRDTGAVGARVLLDPVPHLGKIYEFTGVLSNFAEFADVFSQVLGRKITYVGVTAEQAEQAMRARGMPDWLITHQLTAAHIAAKAALSTENTEPIRNILNRAPITTKQFVEDHKGAFS